MKENNSYELLIKIYELDQSRISNLDSTQFTIKGLSITLVSALVGLSFQYTSKVFLWVGIGASTLFAILDYLYREVQIKHADRSNYILNYIQNTYLKTSQSPDIRISFIEHSSQRKEGLSRDPCKKVPLLWKHLLYIAFNNFNWKEYCSL